MKTERWPIDRGAPRLKKDFVRPIWITSSREADLETALRLQQSTANLLRASLDGEYETNQVLRRQLHRASTRSCN